MEKYETMFVLDAKNEDEASGIVEKIKQVLSASNVSIQSEQNYGHKEFTFEIAKKRDGFYYLLNFSSDPAAVVELRKEFEAEHQILRYLITKQAKKEVVNGA